MTMRILAIILAVFTAASAHAALTSTNLFTFAPVNGTTNGNNFSLAGVYLPQRSYLIQNGGTTNAAGTNAWSVAIQISLDGTNFTTVATYRPSTTNAAMDVYTPSLSSQTITARAQIITTNPISVGTTVVAQ